MRPFLPLSAVLLAMTSALAADEPRFRVPAGFEVTRVAADDLAHDIWCLTLDRAGRIVVGGPGYIRRLDDTDGDGRADRAVTLATFDNGGPQGLCYVGDDLYHVGPQRLRVLRADSTAPPLADSFLAFGNSGEHGAHSIVQGPDGCLYLVCGNDAQPCGWLDDDPAPAVAGRVLRVELAPPRVAVVGWGFRNPYDLAFTADGRLLTVDSDNERAHHLPWYAPTRLMEVVASRGHGWLLAGYQTSWNRPASYFDGAPRVAELGRGSPTGLEVYRHTQFPQHYHGGVFTACWTMGRIDFVELGSSLDGTMLTGRREEFLAPADDNGFAPVDLAVTPAGDLLVAIGGRHTQGGVFRVRYVGGDAARSGPPHDPLLATLDAPQPLAAWSRAVWEPMVDRLGREPFLAAATDARLTIAQRCRALEIITDRWGGLYVDEAHALKTDSPEVLARAAWSLGKRAEHEASPEIVAQLFDWAATSEPVVQAATWEALIRSRFMLSPNSALQWVRAFESPSAQVRELAIAAARVEPARVPSAATASLDNDAGSRGRLTSLRLSLSVEPQPGSHDDAWTAALEMLSHARDPELRRDAVRMMQLLLGDIVATGAHGHDLPGYTAAHPEFVTLGQRQVAVPRLVELLAVDDAELRRESARLLAMLTVPVVSAGPELAAQLTPTSPPADDVHYLSAAARIAGDNDTATRNQLVAGLLALHTKLLREGATPSREWPAWVEGIYGLLLEHDPGFCQALVAHDRFGEPAHVLFTAQLPDDLRQRAAERILGRLQQHPDAAELATPELIELIAELPPETSRPPLRSLFDEFACRDAIALVLLRDAADEDRARLFAALASTDAGIVRQIASALAVLPIDPAADRAAEATATIAALRRFCRQPAKADARQADEETRRALHALAERLAGHLLPLAEAADDTTRYAACFAWYATTFPGDVAPTIAGARPWGERAAAIDWASGDATRGRAVYQRKTCAACHDGANRLGPELTGVATRLARDDLFAAIVEPSRDFIPPYEARLVTTHGGRAYQGLIVYESPEGLLLRTGATTTVRVAGDELLRVEPARRSFMPDGLLDDMSNADLADLYAYLRTLTAP